MDELKVFESPEFGSVRTLAIDGEPWFVAADVCWALDIANSRQAISRLDADEKGFISNDTLGGARRMNIVNEPGLCSLVLSSRKQEAKSFKRWITHEVIPAIRKTGGYIAARADETDAEIMARALLVAQATITKRDERIKALETKTEADKPKVLFADSVAAAKTSILVGEMAKILNQNGFKTGGTMFMEILRNDGYLIKRKGTDYNMPTQRSVEMGIIEIKESTATNPDGSIRVQKTPKITGKGQIYFVNRYCKRSDNEMIPGC